MTARPQIARASFQIARASLLKQASDYLRLAEQSFEDAGLEETYLRLAEECIKRAERYGRTKKSRAS